MDDSNHREGYVAVQRRLFLLHHGFDFDHTFVICDKCAQKQEANGTYKSCDLENDHSPVLIVSLQRGRDYLSAKNQPVADHHSERLPYLADKTTHGEKE